MAFVGRILGRRGDSALVSMRIGDRLLRTRPVTDLRHFLAADGSLPDYPGAIPVPGYAPWLNRKLGNEPRSAPASENQRPR